MDKSKSIKLFSLLILFVGLVFVFSGCDNQPGSYEDVLFLSAEQTGGTSETADSTGLTLTFDVDPTTLTASDITVTGATKGTLSGSGTTRSLTLFNINVANEGTVSVAITSPAGYSISDSTQTAMVYRVTEANMTIGDEYRGGKIAYILQSGDPGYDSNVPHGIIAAIADQSTSISWITGGSTQTTLNGGTSYAFGTGQANTTAMMGQTGYTGGAAQVCYDYTNAARGTGVYSDWYLPSRYELSKLFTNRVVVGGFADLYYWSSSEDNATQAWFYNFNTGSPSTNGKSGTIRVRPVRSF